MKQNGFTLFEILIAIFILAVIMSIVYATFANVTNVMAAVRVSAEELRLREFLVRSFTTNLSGLYTDRALEDEAYRLIGINEDGPQGARDTLRFVSTASIIGGMGLPGDVKEVRYEIFGEDEIEGLSNDEEGTCPTYIQATETPLLAGNIQGLDEDVGGFVAPEGFESPMWTVPIQTMDIQYFSGEEWVDEWDSLVTGRMPWCIHIRLNFAKTEEQLEAEESEGYDPYEDPDLEIVVPIPAGLGGTQDVRLLEDPTLLQQGDGEEGGGDEGARGPSRRSMGTQQIQGRR